MCIMYFQNERLVIAMMGMTHNRLFISRRLRNESIGTLNN